MCKKAMTSGAGAGAAPKQIGSETLPEITMTYDKNLINFPKFISTTRVKYLLIMSGEICLGIS